MMDISKMCRVCRDESDCLLDIFTEPCASNRVQEPEPVLATMLRECSGCSVDKEDGMPQFICVECAEAVRNAYRLRRQCRKSHQYFDQLRLMMKELDDIEYCLNIKDSIEPQMPVSVIKGGATSDTSEPHGREPLLVELVQVKYMSPEPQPMPSPLPDNNEHELAQSDAPIKTPDNKSKRRARSYSDNDSWSPDSDLDHEDDDKTWNASIRGKPKRGRGPYRCKLCKQSFIQKQNLVIHMRVHTGERPYKCSLCPRSFAQKGNLQSHTRCHTGERPFGCPNCPKRFRQFGQLQVHTRTHTGEQPFKCSICQQRFKQLNGLQRHMTTHTGEKTRTSSQETKRNKLK
ncbi:zinc finger protein 677 [Drosophila sechellia]|nr:zinc finger protein 677 [Drosophila sechellia]